MIALFRQISYSNNAKILRPNKADTKSFFYLMAEHILKIYLEKNLSFLVKCGTFLFFLFDMSRPGRIE